MAKRCPYCGAEVEEQDEICKNCNNNLVIQCPYCKQNIKAYEKVCPYCTSKLVKTSYLDYTNIIGAVFSAVWVIINLLFIILFYKHPDILNFKDKDGDSEMVMSKYVTCCLQFGVLVSVPYVINLIFKNRIKFAILGIVLNTLFMIVFSYLAIYIKYFH